MAVNRWRLRNGVWLGSTEVNKILNVIRFKSQHDIDWNSDIDKKMTIEENWGVRGELWGEEKQFENQIWRV